ncbi:hypothetical protein DS906_13280 [Ruegeria sp. A3M17]|nr:hypothetical protein DS906_13280 [Ruegeria sp. A3M17]
MAPDATNCITQPQDEVIRLGQRFDLAGISLAFQSGSPGIAKPNLRNTDHVLAQTQRLREQKGKK